MLDPSTDIAEALEGLDGLMLTGGGDVAPAKYGEAPHPSVEAAEPGRDDFELALIVVLASTRGLPILAICRGVQVLNVACGGTLVQDIPSQVPGALDAQARGPAASGLRARARNLDRQGHRAVEADARAPERRRFLRRQQPSSSGRQGSSRPASSPRPPRPTASSKRLKIPPPRSAWASSGTRKTSCAPANSGRCSKVSLEATAKKVAAGFAGRPRRGGVA